ncbi:MAG TPA: DNA ligase D [Casimicrobiaceae bacterium]|nr:DNA ligase D [Casimicrobiaceae bacterium]
MALERYRQKRDFRVTPEPAGKVGQRRSRKLAFVIQKHAASRLHYDFRLELNGVLLSWAVPKGPSLDPNDKRLAMHVEDHPLEYGDFEGVIPPKQYGAGTVMVWDRGTWTPKADPDEGYAKGRLKFELDGEKLRGAWNLVRSRGGKYGGENSWLLFKEADEFARLGAEGLIAEDRPESVVSGRSLEQIAVDADRVWHSNQSVAANVKSGAIRKPRANAIAGLARIKGARKAPLPDLIEAQLATAAKSPPTGAAWVHEIKYDGYRMLCRVADKRARMVSRTANDWTGDFDALARTLALLPVDDAWLDGEVVALDAKGRTSFQALQKALSAADSRNLKYLAFDLLHLNGFDLRGVALTERKRLLRELLSSAPAAIQYSEHFAVPGPAFLQNVGDLGLEGMISKRADLPYRGGRGPAWQKIKCMRRQEMVIGGFTDPEGSRQGFGALLLGVNEPDGRLAYAGKVGTGFSDAALAALSRSLSALVQEESPFHNPPRGAEARRAHWVRPVLVAEVSFAEWTDDGTLRHPSFLGLRADKRASEVVRERPETSEVDEASDEPPPRPPSRAKAQPVADKNAVAGIVVSNPDKNLYPEAQVTKRDLALYYAAVGEWMLPHVRGRPLTLLRCPNGWNEECFYQKKAEGGVNEAISRVEIQNGDGSVSLYMMADSVPAIVALLQMGVLELHPWGSRAPSLLFPDRIIFDLDPDDAVEWEGLRQAALLVKTLLENVGLAPFLKTTGGKGLHVVVPIQPGVGWETVKGFSKAVAELLERTFPDRFTSKLLKISRRGKIFIDYLRNGEGATAVAAYSTRARANAPVSAPVAWDELSRDLRFDHFNVTNMPKRLKKVKTDPWRDIADAAVALTPAAMARVGFKPEKTR